LISLIIPVRGEAPEAAERFRRFSIAVETEILIADRGDCPETARAFERIGARIVSGPGSRGLRLDRAARQARGDVFFFVHADSRPPENALAAIAETLNTGAVAGAFSLGYVDESPSLAWIAWWANLRSRRLGFPFGDQGLFCRRDAYEASGGFRDLSVCDDVDIVRRLKRVGPLRVRPEKSLTSPRRYVEAGAIRQVLRNWRVLAGYFAGVSPEKLERWYRGKS
jgi:rSAM/selenodomain-associated transferase 2